MIKIQNIKDLEPFKEGLNALKLFSDEQIEMIHITLKPQERIELHKNSIDVIFFVLSGKAKLTVENDSELVEKGSCVEVKKNLDRSWVNIGIDHFSVLAIKKMK